MRAFFAALLLLAVCCLKSGLADLEEFPDPPPEVVEEGNIIGPDTLEFWHSKLALPSSFFPELPERLAAWLDKKQCRIAQPHVYEYFGTWKEARPANCVQGNFDGDGPDDWAMIIECKGKLYLGIFWDGEPERGRVLSFKHLSGNYGCKCNYFEENGIYDGYFIHLVSVNPKELNERVSGRFEYPGYVFVHDGLQLFGDHYYTGRDNGYYQHLYRNDRNEIGWLAFGHSDDEIWEKTPTYWGDAWMRDAATLPQIDLNLDTNRDTLSLPPAYFPELPPQLAAWLEQRKYRIPQVHDIYMEQFTGGFQKHDRYNVIHGNFDGQDERDWVVATFRDDTTKAFICWNADTSSIEQLDISEFDGYPDFSSRRNKDFAPYPLGYGGVGFGGRHIISFEIIAAKVRREWLKEDLSPDTYHNIYGDSTELPTVFYHDGLVLDSGGDMWDGGFVRYFYNGRWIRFWHHHASGKAVIDCTFYDCD